MKRIVVIAEIRHGHLRNVSLEALTAARKMAAGQTDCEIVACVFGEHPEMADVLAEYGADRVIFIRNGQLASYTTAAYRLALLQVLDALDPDAVVAGHTAMGKDLMPRVAATYRAGLVSDCTQIENGNGELTFVRPIYAGKAFEKRTITGDKLFVTVRPNNIPAEPARGRGAVETMDVEVKDLRAVVKEVVRKTAEGVDLSEAKIIVSGGRGVKSAEGFAPLRELASVLGAAVGASRGACDAGYCDYSMQIGQTGKVVTPDLYIACGISGAIQHLAGMSNSKVIVAINTDPEANIFSVADYGIVGDLFEVVPLLTEEFRKIVGKM